MIEATANHVMAETRGALGSRAPSILPGLPCPAARPRQLPSASTNQGGGLPLDLAVTGKPRPVATSIDLSLYRIGQGR